MSQQQRTSLVGFLLLALPCWSAWGAVPGQFAQYSIWIVKVSTDARATGYEVVDGATTEDEASQKLAKWNKTTKSSDPFFYETKRNPDFTGNSRPTLPAQVPQSATKPTVIAAPPVIKTVDPGDIKLSGKVKPLAGMTGTGTIGDSKVTVEFSGEGEKGEFVVTGELEGKGKWVQLGPFVTMETARAKLEGKLDGDMLKGSRTLKGGGAKDEWSLSLFNRVNKLAGSVWDASTLSSYGGELRFDKDGKTVTHATKGWEGIHPAATYIGTYTIDGDNVIINIEYRFKTKYTGVIKQNEITGTRKAEGFDFTSKWYVERR